MTDTQGEHIKEGDRVVFAAGTKTGRLEFGIVVGFTEKTVKVRKEKVYTWQNNVVNKTPVRLCVVPK